MAVGAIAALTLALIIAALLPDGSGGPGVRSAAAPPPGTPPGQRAPAPRPAVTSPARGHTSPSSPDGPAAQPAPAGQQFGANVNRLFENQAYSAGLRSRQLAGLRAAGATLARTDALWEASEPQKPRDGSHLYSWAFDDTIAADLAAHGLRWLPVLDYSVSWAQSIPGVDHSPPASLTDYAAYAAAFAARYGPGGGFWSAHPQLPAMPVQEIEIWNEPDNQVFWAPAANPPRYAAMYALARAAVTAVAPAVRVLIGGLWHPNEFLPAMLAARPDLRGHIDGVAIHPYGATPATILASVQASRSLLDGLGLSQTPLYVTEFGWTTSPPGARDYLHAGLRPEYIAATLAEVAHSGCGVAAVAEYTWITESRDGADPEQWYGISPPEGGSSADVRAFAFGLRAAEAPGRAAAC